MNTSIIDKVQSTIGTKQKLPGVAVPRRQGILMTYLIGAQEVIGHDISDPAALAAVLSDDISVDISFTVFRNRVQELMAGKLTFNQLCDFLDEFAYCRGGHVPASEVGAASLMREVARMLDGTQPQSKSAIVS